MNSDGASEGMKSMDSNMPMPRSMPMSMDLTLKCTCQVGKLFIAAWDIDTCSVYYASLAAICFFCFLRHLLTMHKTRLVLRLAEHNTGIHLLHFSERILLPSSPCRCFSCTGQASDGTTSMLVGCAASKPGPTSTYGSTSIRARVTDEEEQELVGKNGSCVAREACVSDACKPLRLLPSDDALAKFGSTISVRDRIVLTCYFVLLSTSSLLVMLLAMTFNLGVIAAILVGEGAGHLAFASDALHNLLHAGSFH